ncbi:hypothetical protein SeLEV6574_g04958 [Synchytrium endobioticum]|uniref:Uncharacterized protein n=1 Tax=Synchytrium endobioticum TaxID=286115 RepID=A0A507CXJ0_9FUNG|nr:hypothetical protein SeLEV6574_g04958 [Synchytrium endobioticum]
MLTAVAPTRKSKAGLQAEVKQLYIDNHLPELRSTPNIVAIDPSKRDILYCQDRNSNSNLRYTSNQRAKETGSRHYRKQREALKSSHGIDVIASNIPTHKTMDLQGYCRYLIYKSATTVSGPRQAFYDSPVHNRYRWKTFVNTQRSEGRLLRRMKEKYGSEFTVVMGDWSDAGRTARYQTSTKTVGWRRFFRRNRIACYLIDEFRTSKLCPDCDSTLEQFASRPSSRPWKRTQGAYERVHGLLDASSTRHHYLYFIDFV